MPRAPVVMITRDRRDEAVRAVGRLVADDGVARVVVVDNGSSDGTALAVRSRFPPSPGGAGVEMRAEVRVDVIELGRNLGAAGRNLGVRSVDAPYVAFSDDDSWWAPGALARASDVLDAHPRVAVVAARVDLIEGDDERGPTDPTCALMAHSALASPAALPGPLVLGFIACGAVVRRSAFLDVGGFDESLGVGGEEQLLALDLATAGWQLLYVDDVVALHRPSAARDVDARRRRVVRNDLWTAWRRRSLRSAARVTLRHARASIRDRARRAGVVEAARGAPRALRQRRVLPRHVEMDLDVLEAHALGGRAPSPRRLIH
jgi:GT2 family glycosyltransferase